MRRWSIGRQLSLFAVLVVLLPVEVPIGRAQAQQSTLPANWQQLSPTDFANLLRQKYFDGDNFKQLSNADQESLKSQGETLFLQINLSNTALSYQAIEMLHWVARYQFDDSDLATAKTALIARRDDWTGKPYAEIRAKVAMMMRLMMPDAVVVNEARRWVAAGGTLAQVPQQDLNYDIVRNIFADLKTVNGPFSVTWVGQVNPPQSGDYTFSISPINPNIGFKRSPVRFRMTVSVAGQMLLESTPDASGNTTLAGYQPDAKPPKWSSQSTPVTLTVGHPVALQVTVSVDAIRGLPSSTLHAMLFWEGPGIQKSLVPASSLTLPNGSGPGLQATYSWTSNGQPQTLSRTDAMIDFAWTNSSILLSQDMTVANQAADVLWQTMTSPTYLATLAGPPVQLHPFFQNPEETAGGLSTARRQAFLNLLLQNPTLLDAVNAKSMAGFYQAFRMGTPTQALDVFGVWATRHADLVCDFSDDHYFDGDNRGALADMSGFTTQQLPDQVARLEAQYLQLPNGQCVLPVAYTLTYSYLGRRKIADWIAVLDAKLADPTIVGDLRVNWLLARAHAQELLRNPSKHYPLRWPFPATWPLDGRTYLDQAMAAAQTAPVKMRIAQEIVGRLAAGGQFDLATTFVNQLTNSLPDDQKAIATDWVTKMTSWAAIQQQQPVRAKQAYLKTLQARKTRAAQSGDATTVAHYDALINAVQNRP